MLVKTTELISNTGVIPAFNTSTFEMAKAIVSAATEINQPVIIQTSENEARFMGPKYVFSMIKALAENSPVPIALHLDHGKSLELIKECIEVGYSSVMADGDRDFIKQAVVLAHQNGVLVEGNTADFEDVSNFVNETGLDLLAPEKENKIELSQIQQVHQQTQIPLALHGESSYSDEMIRQSLNFGVKKVNFCTPLRRAYTETLRAVLDENPEEIVPYKYLDKVSEAVKKIIIEKINLLR
ncbi:MAG: class II fructose-bisphosphate aldolase [Patescibacteria group bacterium]|nr:class II fructose-bisphosphate aldolase [Patescibacteria group bacterium]